jgi:hypothetical protein
MSVFVPVPFWFYFCDFFHRRKQRFIRTPLKVEAMAGGYTKEHSTVAMIL